MTVESNRFDLIVLVVAAAFSRSEIAVYLTVGSLLSVSLSSTMEIQQNHLDLSGELLNKYCKP